MYSKLELHQLFKKEYESKGSYITIAELCKKLHTGQKTLHQNILDVNAYEDCPDVFLHIKKPLRAFENLTPEAAYWLGYLMADGCIALKKPKNSNQKTTSRLMLECKIDDKEILEKFCEYIGIRKERITIGHKGKSVALSLSTANITTNLYDYGIVPNKSHKEHCLHKIFKNSEELFFQYFKGLVDGDGTIHTSPGSYGVSLVDNDKGFLEEIKKELEKYLPEPSSIWIMEKTIEQQKGKSATQSLFVLKIGSGLKKRSNLQYIYEQFYNNKKIILKRKENSLKKVLI